MAAMALAFSEHAADISATEQLRSASTTLARRLAIHCYCTTAA